jgi:hypothetical protein
LHDVGPDGSLCDEEGLMLTGLLALALVVMKLYPSTPVARSLHRWLVEWPVEAAGRMERRHLILIAILLCCGPSLAALGSADFMMLYAADLSLYADAVLVTSLSAVGLSLKRGWSAFVHRAFGLKRGRPRQRSRRVRAPGSVSAAANDDGPAGAAEAA